MQDKESSSKTKLVKYGDRSELDQEMDRFALLIEGLCGEKDGQGGIQSEGTSGVPGWYVPEAVILHWGDWGSGTRSKPRIDLHRRYDNSSQAPRAGRGSLKAQKKTILHAPCVVHLVALLPFTFQCCKEDV